MTTLLLDNLAVPFTVIRSAKRKRTLSLVVQPSGHLLIRVSLTTKFDTIKNFVEKNKAWVLRKIAENAQRPPIKKNNFASGEKFFYLGKEYSLQIAVADIKKSQCCLDDFGLQLRLAKPENAKIDIQQQVMGSLKKWYCSQASLMFTTRIAYWEQRLGVKAQQVRLSYARSRWGSCTHKNNIRLNWRLIMAELALIDYVIAHELCHIVHKNHSKAFWQLLASVMPDYKARKLALHNQAKVFFNVF